MTEIRESALHCSTEIRNKIPYTRCTPRLKYGSRLFYTENILHLMIKIYFCGSCIAMKRLMYLCNLDTASLKVFSGLLDILWPRTRNVCTCFYKSQSLTRTTRLVKCDSFDVEIFSDAISIASLYCIQIKELNELMLI